MNREIKFRIWDKQQRKFHTGADWGISLNGSCIIGFSSHDSWNDDRGYKITLSNQDNLIVQQYTGLKDSKGNEIYEGDILERIQSPGEPRNYYQVIWHDYMWIAVCTRKNYSHCLDQFNEVKQCKIVGNIFDNPELIKNNDNNN